MRTICKWFQNFWSGHISKIDAEHFERLLEVTVPETTELIHDKVIDDKRVKVCKFASVVGIS